MNATRRTVSVSLILLATWALVVGTTFRLAARTSPDLPKYDDWPAMVPALTGHQPITAKWLWQPHVNHRIVLPRLAYLAAFHLTGGDFRAGQFLSVGLLGLTAWLGMRLARRWRGSSSLADAFFPLMLLHWGQSQLFLLGTVLNFTFAVALNYCALFLLLRAGNLFNGKHALVLFACLASLALTGLVGLLMAIPYLVWLGGVGCLHLRQSRRDGWLCLGITVILAIIVICPFIGLPLAPEAQVAAVDTNSSFQACLNNLAILAAMSLGWMAKSRFVLSLTIVIAVSLAAAGWLAFIVRTRPDERYRASALLVFMSGVAAVVASIGYGRAYVTDEQSLATTRYAAVSVALLVAGFLGSFFLGRRGAIVQSMLCILAGIVFLGSALEANGYSYALQPHLHVRAHEDALIRGIMSGKSLEQAASDFFPHENGYSSEQGARWLAMLREKQLGPFGMSEREKARVLDWWEPDAEAPLLIRHRESDRFLGDGWCVQGDPDGRWTNSSRAMIRFRVDPSRSCVLIVRMLPFVVPGKLDRQRVSLAVNGRVLTTLVLDRWDWQNHEVALPAAWLRTHNTLELVLPDATAPQSIGYNGDPEPHAVMVQSIDVKCVGPLLRLSRVD